MTFLMFPAASNVWCVVFNIKLQVPFKVFLITFEKLLVLEVVRVVMLYIPPHEQEVDIGQNKKITSSI